MLKIEQESKEQMPDREKGARLGTLVTDPIIHPTGRTVGFPRIDATQGFPKEWASVAHIRA
ncbi:hypothetical protein TBK1r_22660 [Stieleria magnilauensis]|uniref:Uncharacterized protein n=1 Tax=Stieleria magnilauensis TaxID=2527963 RepID=A0ABX5XMW2_9BACT|nr:hypothetical protein TBK1r_22660 [Planctomycetes bacterium TBK1r]